MEKMFLRLAPFYIVSHNRNLEIHMDGKRVNQELRQPSSFSIDPEFRKRLGGGREAQTEEAAASIHHYSFFFHPGI